MAKSKRKSRKKSRPAAGRARRQTQSAEAARPPSERGAARARGPLPGERAAPPAVRDSLLVAAALVLLAGAVYFPVTDHEFVDLDDPFYFVENPNLDGRFDFEDVKQAFASPYVANWIPLTWISIAIDNALYGPEPAGYLVTNAALHALGSILLFLALARMTGQLGPSAFVAAVFAVHPLHVESVAWATERKDALMGVFWMATLYAYARYAERPSAARYAAVLLFVALSLLAKPVAVTLPFALLLLDYWPLQRLRRPASEDSPQLSGPRGALLEKLPLFALAAAASVVTLVVQLEAGAGESVRIKFPLRVMNAALSYVSYLGDSVWPSRLAVFYPYSASELRGGLAVGACALLALATAASARLAASRPYLLVGWLWFLGTLVPMIGLVQVGGQARADRYMYVPLVGLAIAAAWGALDLLRGRRRARSVAASAACGVVALLTVAAHVQVRYWSDSVTLCEHALAVTKSNTVAHKILGTEYRKRGALDKAEDHLREALRIRPGWGEARGVLGMVLLDTGRATEARAELLRALENGADPVRAHTALGLVAERLGDPAGAVSHYRKALQEDAEHLEAANNLAFLLATSDDPALRDPETAIRLAEGALARDPDNPSVLDTLAASYAAARRYDDALRTQSRALQALAVSGDDRQTDEFRARLREYRERARSRPAAQ